MKKVTLHIKVQRKKYYFNYIHNTLYMLFLWKKSHPAYLGTKKENFSYYVDKLIQNSDIDVERIRVQNTCGT